MAENYTLKVRRFNPESGDPAYYTTPHYEGYGAVIVNLAVIERPALEELITQAWRIKAPAAIRAAMRNHLQRSVNILHGSVLASIGLTVPAVLTIGIITHRPITLGLEGGNVPLLVLTLGASVVTFGSGRTSVLQGCIHLLLFAVFVLLIFCP